MPPITIKVNLYKLTVADVASSLPDLLAQIDGDALVDRIRTTGRFDVRLEYILAPHSAGNDTNFWLLDFIKLRMDHGPGKVGKTTAIEGFALGDDEGFGEETSVLFDPATNYLLVQYNHHGVRGASIARYFSNYNHADVASVYEMDIKLDDSSEAKLAAKNIITKVHFKIAPAQMTAAHRINNVSLGRALALNDDQSGSTVELTISANRGQNLATRSANGLLNSLKSLMRADRAQDTNVLTQFDVEAKAQLTDRAEKIDMLLPALQAVVDGVEMGPDRRYTVASRWTALIRARRGWAAIMRR